MSAEEEILLLNNEQKQPPQIQKLSDGMRIIIVALVLLSTFFVYVSSTTTSTAGIGRKILVTGSNGLIGSHVIRALLDECENDQIYGLIRFNSKLNNLKGVLPQIKLVKGDLTDSFRMNQIIAEIRPNIIYHFGAQSVNGISYENPSLTMKVNVEGTLNLLEALKHNGLFNTRFIFAGSSTEYGNSANSIPLQETNSLKPITPYGVSKITGELLSLQYFYTYKIPVIILRFFLQIGAGSTDSLAIQSFCKQIAQIENDPTMPRILYHGNLDTVRDISDIKEMSPVIIALGEKGIPGEAYNVGTGHGVLIKDLLMEAINQSRVQNIEIKSKSSLFRILDEPILLADMTKTRKILRSILLPSFNQTKVISIILNDWRKRMTE